jgi:hypothetical protein
MTEKEKEDEATRIVNEKDPHKVLGLYKNASLDIVNKYYRDLLEKYKDKKFELTRNTITKAYDKVVITVKINNLFDARIKFMSNAPYKFVDEDVDKKFKDTFNFPSFIQKLKDLSKNTTLYVTAYEDFLKIRQEKCVKIVLDQMKNVPNVQTDDEKIKLYLANCNSKECSPIKEDFKDPLYFDGKKPHKFFLKIVNKAKNETTSKGWIAEVTEKVGKATDYVKANPTNAALAATAAVGIGAWAYYNRKQNKSKKNEKVSDKGEKSNSDDKSANYSEMAHESMASDDNADKSLDNSLVPIQASANRRRSTAKKSYANHKRTSVTNRKGKSGGMRRRRSNSRRK